MKALRVSKNEDGSKVIALDHPGVLNAIINCIDTPTRESEEMSLDLGGLDSTTGTHVTCDRKVLPSMWTVSHSS
ncbi:MAG: hypothetical protein ACI9UA_003545 [Pseudoalteromonas tetraodonis]|jgi:hypothetical protein